MPVSENAKVGDISYNTGQFHTFAKIVDCTHILVELKKTHQAARIAFGLFKLLHDVLQDRHFHGGSKIFVEFNLLP